MSGVAGFSFSICRGFSLGRVTGGSRVIISRSFCVDKEIDWQSGSDWMNESDAL